MYIAFRRLRQLATINISRDPTLKTDWHRNFLCRLYQLEIEKYSIYLEFDSPSVWRLKRVTIQLALCCYQQNLPNDTSVLCMVVNLKILDIFDLVNLQYKIISNIMCRRFMKRFGLTQLISLIQLLENSVDMWFHSDCWISSMLNIKVLILYFTTG